MASIVNTCTDKISISYTGNGAAVTTPVGTYTGAKDAGVAQVIPAGSVNLEIDVTFPHATIQSLVMSTDQDLTVLVNSTSTPTETITIKKTAGLVGGSAYAAA